MKQLIADYEAAKNMISRRIDELERQRSENMPTIERERLDTRLNCLREERFELTESIIQMRRREVLT